MLCMRKEDSNVSLIKPRDSKILKCSAQPEADYRLLGENFFIVWYCLLFCAFFDKGSGSDGNDERLYHLISSHTPIARFWQVIAISSAVHTSSWEPSPISLWVIKILLEASVCSCASLADNWWASSCAHVSHLPLVLQYSCQGSEIWQGNYPGSIPLNGTIFHM